MLQRRPYEFLVQYTPQREWIERQGILLWLAFFFIELGAGTFFISSIFDNLLGMLIGWLICGILGGGCHILYLGRPLRFYRAFLKPQTSWISRGLIFVFLFLVLGAIHMVLAQWVTPVFGLLLIVDLLAFLTIIYGGFAMNCVNGIPLWNTSLLPILYVVSGLWGGAGLTLVGVMASGATSLEIVVEGWGRILLVSFAVILAVYLISMRYGTAAGKISVREIVRGRGALLFWILVVLLGMVFPTAIVINSFLADLETAPAALLYVAICCELIGDLGLRYLILKQGLYGPIIPSSSYDY